MDFASLAQENAALKALLARSQSDLAEHRAALAASEEARRRLEIIIDDLRREKFGSKSEKLTPDQFNLPLEDIEIAQGVLDAAQEKAEAIIKGKSDRRDRSRDSNRGRLPAHLPRVERVIEPRSTMCPCGCGPMTMIGEDVSERLDVIPAQFRVLVTRRPKYACRRCSGAVAQAHAPEHVVPGGLPTEALIAQVIVAKFGDHLPFYRQAEIYARQGVILDRATLGNWAGRACFHLQPIADHMSKHLASADRVFMDETTAPVLDPGRRRTKKGFFWAIASDDRGHGGTGPPIVLFRYAPGRGGAHADWAGLTRFLEDGRLELDTNPVENAIRPVALTRKNALFAGNEIGAENWALLASIVATCKLNNVDPVAYITDTLQAILDGHPQSRVEELMPWNFHPASSLAA
jgi:transposase